MKATIDIPDDLYRRVKAKSAMEGLAVREVAVSLFDRWVHDAATAAGATAADATTGEPPVPAWYGGARRQARRVARHDMASVRRSIARGRIDEAVVRKNARETAP